jgi:heptosyltransferase-2
VGESGSVIVVRTPNWLGDTVMALPALAALRSARREARIVAMGRWARQLSGQGVADVVLGYPEPAAERIDAGRALRQERPEMAVLLVNSFEAALAARWWRAARRIGFDTDGRRPLLTDAPPLPSPRRHQIDEYGELIAVAGARLEEGAVPTWRLPANRSRAEEVDRLLAEAGVRPGARLIGLHLGAAFGASKLWPAESYGCLAELLSERGVWPILLGAADAGPAAQIASRGAGLSSSLVGRDRPALLPQLVARLSCLVSGDTGVAHLAAALDVPTVTLFGPTDPRLTAPRGKRARVLYRGVACSPCFLSSCPIDHVCLRDITPEEVLSAIGEAMAA